MFAGANGGQREVRGDQMRSEVRGKVRAKKLRYGKADRKPGGDTLQVAGQRLRDTYLKLAERGEHLLGRLLGGQAPVQWQHYPEADAVDVEHGYLWFYHSHSPEDRSAAGEHGHFHLFARRKLWSRSLRSRPEKEFSGLSSGLAAPIDSRHLIGISVDAKGLPIRLFTVNSWVTGDLMLGTENTLRLLLQMTLNTGYAEPDAVLECVIALCREEIHQLLIERDAVLFGSESPGVLQNEGVEVLSEIEIDLDRKLATNRISS